MHSLQQNKALASGKSLTKSRTAIPGVAVPCRAHLSSRSCVGYRVRTRAYETAQEARDRVMVESAVVDSRVEWVDSVSSLKEQLRGAGTKLVVLEIQSESVCEAGFDVQPELHWKLDQKAAERRSMEACSRIKHTFSRTARECTDVVFLSIQIPDGSEGEDLKRDLGVELVPAIQFYREGELLWQQQGHTGMEQEMGEGVLYYGNAAAGGLKATEFVQDINSQYELEQFINSGDNTLRVVNVSTTLCKPCIKVYPAVLALAKNFVGHAQFGRLMGDDSDENEQLMLKMGILEVPTFIFYRGGKELGRHVGSSRGDLIGNILQYQAAAGLRPPPPPPKAQVARARPVKKPARRW